MSLNLDEKKIIQMYKEGMTCENIGYEFKCCGNTIRNRLEKNNIKIRTVSESHKVENRSKEERLRLSKAVKGKNNPMYGKKHSEATKKKISKAMKGKLRGKDSPHWKGGITQLSHLIRTSSKSKQWRLDVFNRDDFICKECLKRGGDLNAHHIKSFSKIMKEYNIKNFKEAENCQDLWNIDNGKTLCEDCHIKTYRGDSY